MRALLKLCKVLNNIKKEENTEDDLNPITQKSPHWPFSLFNPSGFRCVCLMWLSFVSCLFVFVGFRKVYCVFKMNTALNYEMYT